MVSLSLINLYQQSSPTQKKRKRKKLLKHQLKALAAEELQVVVMTTQNRLHLVRKLLSSQINSERSKVNLNSLGLKNFMTFVLSMLRICSKKRRFHMMDSVRGLTSLVILRLPSVAHVPKMWP